MYRSGHFLIDGFTLHHLARPGSSGYEADGLFGAMRALFIAHVAGETEVARCSSRLRQPLSEPARGRSSRPRPLR
ncbi:MAG: hypothetical protein ACYCV7_17400 [Acidimicrobiales bacterium]